MNAQGVAANLWLRFEEPEGRMMKPRVSGIRRGETTPYPSSKHFRGLREELSCSSRWSPASPSLRIDSSSCDSRLALPRSCARLEPYTPWPEPHRTPATTESLRFGAATSIPEEYAPCRDETTRPLLLMLSPALHRPFKVTCPYRAAVRTLVAVLHRTIFATLAMGVPASSIRVSAVCRTS